MPTDWRERIGKVFNFRLFLPVRPCHGDDVEACPMFQQSMAFEVAQCQPSQPTLFGISNRLGGVSRLMRLSCFDFHEDDRPLVDRDQVHLAQHVTFAAGHDKKAEPLKKTGSGSFAASAKRLGRSPLANPGPGFLKRIHF